MGHYVDPLKARLRLFQVFMWAGVALVASVAVTFYLLPTGLSQPKYSPSGFYRQYKDSILMLLVKMPNGGQSGGTGFTIELTDKKRYTVTNAHICRPVGVGGFLTSKNEFNTRQIPIKVIAIYDRHDLCLAEAVPGSPPLKLAATDPKVGDEVTVIGHPHLMPLTPSTGVILDKYGMVELSEADTPKDQCVGPGYEYTSKKVNFFGVIMEIEMCMRTLQSHTVTCTVYPGNSGSPVLNKRGKVVGVLFAGDNVTHMGDIVPLVDLEEFLLTQTGDIGSHED